jgi:predicted AlkP superfamily phosphohydrolase/phosphomutase
MGYRIELDQWYRRGHEQETMDGILSVMRVQEQAVRKLMAEREWDLFTLVFRATDLAQHYFWRFMDPGHPDHTPEEAERYGNLIPRVYEECDAAIARLMEAAGPGTNVFVVSDHGFGRETKMVHLSNWLHHLGYLRFNQSPLGRLKKLTFDLGMTADNVMNTLGRLGLEKLFTRATREMKSRIFSTFFLNYGDIDWSRTRAYARGQIGQIFLNVRGREPEGIVDPGDEYRILRSEIIQRLHEMTDPDNGRPMVDRVYVKEEIYTGKHVEAAPDILIDWRDMEYWAFDVLAGGRKIVAPNLRTRSGGHRMNGIFLALGPDIAGTQLDDARIIDVAPTLLHLLGLPVPDHMDGRVLQEVFAETSAAARQPVRFESTNGSGPAETVGYTPEEEEKVKERLSQLGYLS